MARKPKISRPRIERYRCVAFTGPTGFVKRTYATGTSTFDEIWRSAPSECSHIVLYNGRWLVTDRFTSGLRDDAFVALGPVATFDDEESAVMAAVLMAGQGNDRQNFAHLCAAKFAATRRGKRADALARVYAGTLGID